MRQIARSVRQQARLPAWGNSDTGFAQAIPKSYCEMASIHDAARGRICRQTLDGIQHYELTVQSAKDTLRLRL